MRLDTAKMDFDIEMDDAFEAPQIEEVPQIPEAYTHDIITGEEQVRTRRSAAVDACPVLISPVLL